MLWSIRNPGYVIFYRVLTEVQSHGITGEFRGSVTDSSLPKLLIYFHKSLKLYKNTAGFHANSRSVKPLNVILARHLHGTLIFIWFLARTYEGGWPVIVLVAESSHRQCAVSVLIMVVGRGGALIDSTPFVRRVVGSTPALAAT